MKENHLLYEDAKKFVQELKLKSNSEWRNFCGSGEKPKNIPTNPDRVYKNKGWKNWPDWLGSNTKPNKNPLLKFNRNEVQKILSERLFETVGLKEGKIIEGTYKNKTSTFLFECKKGHQWHSQAQTVLGGSWCRQCFNEEKAGKHLKLKSGLEEAFKIASDRKGKCLSKEYINNKTPLGFECNNGHKWKAALGDIRKGSWCPNCGKGIRERLCRNIFEQITSKKFPKKRPKWLLNTRNHQMELDGYCEELKIAFEHHGEYHYLRNEHFQRRNESLEKRKLDDKTKIELCENYKVTLIIVPYYVKTTDLKNFIFKKLSDLNLEIPLREDFDDKYIISNELEELNSIAKKNGGKCLSNIFLGVDQKHKFVCAKGHIFESLPSNIKSKRKTWCPTCKPNRIGDSNRKYSVNDMQKVANKKKGKFLSSIFKSVNDKYLWECESKHQWRAAPMDILKGTWCKKCSNLNKNLPFLKCKNLQN